MPDVDLSEFYRLSKPRKPPCQVGLILTGQMTPKLKPEQVAQLEAALGTDAGIITSSAVVAWLKAQGHDSNTNRVSNHRRGVCTCGEGS
jgi:hypothetical protein